jgi:DNA-binding winged helix-turn-helix (wHTH) protein/TolB-like protein
MSDRGLKTFEFGPFRADAQRRVLERDGQAVPLTGKAFEILWVLLEHAGELVSKEILMQAVWPDTAVEENNLTVNISGLRKALGDTAASPRLIVTVSGRGYRFAGQINQRPGETSAKVVAVADRGRSRLYLAAGAIVLLAGLAVAAIWMRTNLARTIAVLPFRVLNEDAGNEYLGIGLTDALITRLSNIREITVRPMSSVARLAGKDAFQAGADVIADSVLEGSVQTVNDRVRVSVRMLRVRDRAPMWAESFDEDSKNLFQVEDSISTRVASSLVRHLSGVQQDALAKRYPATPRLTETTYAADFTAPNIRKTGSARRSAICKMRSTPTRLTHWPTVGWRMPTTTPPTCCCRRLVPCRKRKRRRSALYRWIQPGGSARFAGTDRVEIRLELGGSGEPISDRSAARLEFRVGAPMVRTVLRSIGRYESCCHGIAARPGVGSALQ